MADTVAPLIAQLRADLNQFRAEMRNVERVTQQTSTRANRGFQSMTKEATLLERGIGSIGTQVVALGAGFFGLQAAIRGISSAGRTIGNFQQSMAGVLAVTQATTAQMEQAEAAARQLGATTQFTASEAGRGMEFLGRAGFKTTEIIKAMPAVLDLAAAGILSMGEAADIASNIMSGFGIAAEDFTKVADILAATAANANTNVQQLGEGMKFVAPVARALDISIEDTAAAMGVLSNAGLQASLAGTGLRRILSELSNPSNETAEAVERLGLRLTDLDPTVNSLADIVNRFKSASLSAADALTIMGDRGGPALLALTGQTDQLAELNEKLTDVEGTARRMREVMEDTLPGAINKFKASVESVILSLGDSGLAGFMQGVIEKAAELVSGLNALSPATRDIADAFRDLEAEASGIEKSLESAGGLSAFFAAAEAALGGGRDPAEARQRLKEVQEEMQRLAEIMQEQAEEANFLAEVLGRVNDGQQKGLDLSKEKAANRARERRAAEQQRIEQELAIKDQEELGEAFANEEEQIKEANANAQEFIDTLQEVTDQRLGLDELGDAWGNLEKDINKGKASAQKYTAELERVQQEQQAVVEQFNAQIQGALSNTLLASLKGEIESIQDLLGGLTDIFLRQLTDMAAAALLENITVPILFDASSTPGARQAGTGGLPFGLTGGEALGAGILVGSTAIQIAQIQDQQQQLLSLLGAVGGGVLGAFFGGPTGAAGGATIGAQFGGLIPERFFDDIATAALNTAALGIPTLLDETGVSNALFGNDITGAIGGALGLGGGGKPSKPEITLAVQDAVLELVDGTIRATTEVVVDIVKFNKTPGQVEEEIAQALQETLQNSFDAVAEVINELPDIVSEGLLDPLQATFDDIIDNLGGLRQTGDDFLQDWQEFLRTTLPGQLEDELGPIFAGANIFRAGFNALEDAILDLQQAQVGALSSIQTTRSGLAEGQLTPEQLLQLRQTELQQNVSAFESGDAARRIQLAPIIEQIASSVFTVGTTAFGSTINELGATLRNFEIGVQQLTSSIALLDAQSQTRLESLKSQAQSILDSQRSGESLLQIEQQRLQELLIEFDASTAAERIVLVAGIQAQVNAVNQAAIAALVTDTQTVEQQAELLTIQNESINLLNSLREEIGEDFTELISAEEAAINTLAVQQELLLGQQIIVQQAQNDLQANTLGVLDRLTLETSAAFDTLIGEGLGQITALANMVTGLDALREANTEHFTAANEFLQRIEVGTGIQTAQFGEFANDFESTFEQQFSQGQEAITFLTGIAQANLTSAGLLSQTLQDLVLSNLEPIEILSETDELIRQSNVLLEAIRAGVTAQPTAPAPGAPSPGPGSGGVNPTPPPPAPPTRPLIFPVFHLGLPTTPTGLEGLPAPEPFNRWVLAWIGSKPRWRQINAQTNLDPSDRVPASERDRLGITGSNIPWFQEGTPFVPFTGPAVLHRGEAVIPAPQNPFTQGGSMGSTDISVSINIERLDGTDRSGARLLVDDMADELVERISAELLQRERFGKPRGMTTVR